MTTFPSAPPVRLLPECTSLGGLIDTAMSLEKGTPTLRKAGGARSWASRAYWEVVYQEGSEAARVYIGRGHCYVILGPEHERLVGLLALLNPSGGAVSKRASGKRPTSDWPQRMAEQWVASCALAQDGSYDDLVAYVTKNLPEIKALVTP